MKCAMLVLQFAPSLVLVFEERNTMEVQVLSLLSMIRWKYEPAKRTFSFSTAVQNRPSFTTTFAQLGWG